MVRLIRAIELYFNYFVRRRTPVIVYSMKRTGSTALFHSLNSHGEFALTTHCLDPEKINTVHLSGSARWACKHIIIPHKRVKIISLIRNPIENMMSVFARDQLSSSTDRDNSDNNNMDCLSAEDICQHFITEYFQSERYVHQLEWFDCEFKSVLGINIFDYPFDKKRGYVHFQEGSYDVLIVRTEMDDVKKAYLVSEFLGLSDFNMLCATSVPNATSGMDPGMPGEKASYSDQYKVLKHHVFIPKKYLDIILESRFSQHFFPKEILNKTKERFMS